MSKTKEIEGWVYKSRCDDYGGSLFHDRFPDNFDSINAVKARLIIEIPEKTVTITESEFDERFKLCFGGAYYAVGIYLKNELFGDKK